MRVNTNTLALFKADAYRINSGDLKKTLEKLSTGLRINRASDDAAGLSISEELRTQIRGSHQAIQNVQEGVGFFKILEGTCNEVHSNLQRMREISIQASNATLTDTDRSFLHQEAIALLLEIDRMAASSSYLNSFQLDGSFSNYSRTSNTGNEAIATEKSITVTDSSTLESYLGKELQKIYTIIPLFHQIITALKGWK